MLSECTADDSPAIPIAIPPRTTAPDAPFLAKARITLTHLYRHHRIPNLTAPQTFNEHVHHRKLHDRDARLPPLTDKIRAKAIVAAAIGSEWTTPTLWQGTTLPDRPEWPVPFVIKSRHGCNQNIYVHDANPANWHAIENRTRKWMASNYGKWLDEWAYTQIPRGLLVEPFIGTGPVLPLDYKLFVFGGRVEYIQVHLGRNTRHRWIVMDRQWQRRSSSTADPDPACPATLPRMITAAETLAQDFNFARVDLYEVGGQPLFGEMTFYPGSGLCRFDPISLDSEMGTRFASCGISKYPDRLLHKSPAWRKDKS